MRSRRVSARVQAIRASLLVATVASLGCLRNPAVDAAVAEALNEMATQLAAFQQDNAVLQTQVDSLQRVVARQDTVLRRLANMAGLPMAP